MQATFLSASVPLTKSYTVSATGGMTKTPYPFVQLFSSNFETINNLLDFERVLKRHAALGHSLLKGSIAKPLINESRAGSTDSNATTEMLILDLDGLPELIHGKPLTIDLFLKELGLEDITHVVQWSAGYGIENKKIRAHVFFMLDRPYAAPLIKQWLIQKNHETALLSDSMALTKTQNTLSWPLDISACQNDKLIYIAPPSLKGIKDPMVGKSRITYMPRKNHRLALSTAINTVEKNKTLTHAKIAELRKAAGLSTKKPAYKMYGSQEVMLKPDESTITEMKTDRGFVYFNLNGGDSWAYYHPENNPDYILNFKGEPAYLTKELLPDYWAQITATPMRTNSAGLTYLAFNDRASGAYWRGTYDAANDVLDLAVAKSETILRHYCLEHGLRLGDFIPEWALSFDPTDTVRVDIANKTVNTFAPSIYMKAVPKPNAKAPKVIMKVLSNALGSDPDIISHFVNWLAYIVQFRDRTGTAWILHGVPGTGKGILMNNIIRPLFGQAHTAVRRMEELNEPYNHFMADKFIVFVDEVQTKALQNERGVMAKLKNFITEVTVTIRMMYSNAHEVRNYTNWIFASNMSDPVSIDKEDRRFNVSKYQPNKLVITEAEVAAIDKELQAFHDYLLQYACDPVKARTVMQTEDRATMMSMSESSADTVANAIMEGNFNFFLQQLPADNNYERNALLKNRVDDYRDALKTVLARTDLNNGACPISREELRTIFEYVVGGMPNSPNKFTSLLRFHRMHLKVVWIASKSVNGTKADWKDFAQFPAYIAEHFPVAAPPKALRLIKHA